MILIDTGPLKALADANDDWHRRAVEAAASLSGPLLTTEPVLTESCYLLGQVAGWHGQQKVLQLVVNGRLRVASLGQEGLERAYAVMEKYKDVPMDLGDASLVVVAAEQRLCRIFTFDRHFRAYRLPDRRAFGIIPADV